LIAPVWPDGQTMPNGHASPTVIKATTVEADEAEH
jgi:hypothetical protein